MSENTAPRRKTLAECLNEENIAHGTMTRDGQIIFPGQAAPVPLAATMPPPKPAGIPLALGHMASPPASVDDGPGPDPKTSPANPETQLPARVKLLNWGRNETTEGPVIVDDSTAQSFAANQTKLGRDRVTVDYEHNTVPGSDEFNRTSEPRDVAGHSALECIPGDGIYAKDIVYTPSGQSSARNYEDVSAAPYLDKDRRVIALHSWALTHNGAAYGINYENSPEDAADNAVNVENSAGDGPAWLSAGQRRSARAGMAGNPFEAANRIGAAMDRDNVRAGLSKPRQPVALSASASPAAPARGKGPVDLAAVLDAENARQGLTKPGHLAPLSATAKPPENVKKFRISNRIQLIGSAALSLH